MWGGVPGIYLSSLDGAVPKLLTADADFAPLAYLPSGWLLWSKSGALTAQRLDIDGATLTGQPHTLADNVGSVSVSVDGNLAYRTSTTLPRQLSWVDRSGAAVPVGDSDFSLASPRVAPDGRRLAFTKNAKGIPKIWLLEGLRTSRMTFDEAPDQMPLWSPDGSKIVFTSLGIDRASLHQKASSGAGETEVLLAAANAGLPAFATSWSTDRRYLLYFAIAPGMGPDIWVLPMTGDRKPFVFLSNPAFEAWGQFSPDGRWVAYQSDESGQNEIYVRPFVESGNSDARDSGGQWPVSTAGGIHPMWRPDGKEIYYVSPRGEMMAVPIAVDGSAVVLGAPVSLFNVRIYGGGLDRIQGRQYDVAPDGRFLINIEIDSGEAATDHPDPELEPRCRQVNQKKLPGIFISYRRSDTPDAVGRIYDRLVTEFGKARVFKDVDSIPLGQDFRGHLNDIVGDCAAVLAIIGPKWIDTRNAAGQRRLEDPDDFVRIELEAALARNVPVVPVLVGHAPMPGTLGAADIAGFDGVSPVDRSAAGSGFSQ